MSTTPTAASLYPLFDSGNHQPAFARPVTA
jgi:hypothetical protein